MDGAPPSPPPTPGRGAPSNHASARFGAAERVADGDWLDDQSLVDGAPAKVATTVTIEQARSVISYNQSPDLGFDRAVNSYRGCEHGCVYCYARPTHAWLDLSPGLDFETRLFAKPDGASLLRRELAARHYRVAPLAIGTNTDPYQPVEGRLQLTRQIVDLMAEARHPLMITTKSDRIVRDIDLLAPMAERGLVGVAISVTTLDGRLARLLEPRAPHPRKRLAAISALVAAGIPTQVNVSPIIPAITDHEVERILAASAQAGAQRASYILLRLPHEVAPLFRQWLSVHYPDRASKVMSIVQSMRGGRDNDPDFGSRMRGTGVWAELVRTRFRRAARVYGLDGPDQSLRTDLFVPPERDGQMRLI